MKKIKSVKKYESGGAKDEKCWPGKPGCGYKKAQRVNKRRSSANKAAPILKKIGAITGTIGAGALGYVKNIGGIKDKIEDLKQHQKGGTHYKGKITKNSIITPNPYKVTPKSKITMAQMGGTQKTGSKIKSGIKKLFTQTHKAGPSRAKKIR